MKIATTNKLANLQVEFTELCEQLNMLQQQAKLKNTECQSLSNYIQLNSGDKQAMAKYRKACSEYNSLTNNIVRSQARLRTLTGRIEAERQREALQLQRIAASNQRATARAMQAQANKMMRNSMQRGFR